MAAAKTIPEPDRTVQRLIGQGKAKLDDSRRKLDAIERRPRPAAEHPTGDMTFDDDTLNKIVDGVAKRQKQQSTPEIHVHVGDSKPDSDPPDSDESALSFHTPLGRVSARGRVVWAVVGLLALLLVGVLLGRVTAPSTRTPVESQK